jgi:hypothetical protein
MARTLTLAWLALLWTSPSMAHENAYLLLRAEEAKSIRKLAAKDPDMVELLQLIRARAGEAMKLGPWSVTFAPSKAPSGDPHDYYSEAPYWWPDPSNPDGPYIRRDGEVNRNRFLAHETALNDLSNTVLTLATAWYVLGDTACAKRAAELVRVWFVDPRTRMNPHLEYAQAVPGRSTGRPAGIIDGKEFIWLLQGLALMRDWIDWPAAEQRAIQDWFRRYLQWLTTSNNGMKEKAATNNHATWWTAQMMAIASYLGDSTAVRAGCEHFRNHLVPIQIQPDGTCPRELARTRSLSYSAMNMDGFTVICRIARTWGEDLYAFAPPGAGSVVRGIEFVLPFVLRPAEWHRQQITPFHPEQRIFMALAGLDLGREDLLRHYLELPRAADAIYPLLELVIRSRAAAAPEQ